MREAVLVFNTDITLRVRTSTNVACRVVMTWASVVTGKKGKASSSLPPPTTHTTKISDEVMSRFNDAERRTQVLRRVPVGTTTRSIIADLSRQIDAPLSNYIEAVVQDDLERRRFYIRYKTVEQRRTIARRGFRIGEITIPAETADVSGYLPNVPHYMDHQACVSLLSMWGTLTKAEFVCDPDTGVTCGGFTFELDLHENARLPNRIKVLNDVIIVTTKDDHRVCSYCDTLGHIRRHCKKRDLDLVNRANQELLELSQVVADQEMLDIAVGERELPQSGQEQLQGTETSASTKRPTPSNGHSQNPSYPKRQSINALFEEFTKPNNVSDEQYKEYTEQRKIFGSQARREVATVQYPGREMSTLTRVEWEEIQSTINDRFRALLTVAFPENHEELNTMYILRKQTKYPVNVTIDKLSV